MQKFYIKRKLLHLKSYADELVNYLKYTKNLEYEEDPKYDYLIELFEKIIKVDLNEMIDYRYDWIISREKKEKDNDKKNNISLISDDINKSKDRINISTLNNVNNTTLGFKEIGEEIKKNVENVENKLITNNNQNININISININNNNNNININNDNKNEIEKKDKKNNKNKKKENKKKDDEEEDNDINAYEGIMKEYKTEEKENKDKKPEKKDSQKRLCCIIF